ncbi:MAG: hypothetical protein AAF211_15260, partial [Myxococcota bacterium]
MAPNTPDPSPIAVIQLMTEVTAGFSSAQDVESVALEVGRTIEQLIPVELSGLYFWDDLVDRLRLLYAHGFSEEERREAERTAWDRH